MLSKSDWLGIALTAISSGLGFLVGGPITGSVFLIFGLIALVVWHRKQDVLPPSAASPHHISVVAAHYVSKDDPAKSGNVKRSVRAYVKNGRLDMVVENSMFVADIAPDGDPDHGHDKKLVLRFQLGSGPVELREFDEHSISG